MRSTRTQKRCREPSRVALPPPQPPRVLTVLLQARVLCYGEASPLLHMGTALEPPRSCMPRDCTLWNDSERSIHGTTTALRQRVWRSSQARASSLWENSVVVYQPSATPEPLFRVRSFCGSPYSTGRTRSLNAYTTGDVGESPNTLLRELVMSTVCATAKCRYSSRSRLRRIRVRQESRKWQPTPTLAMQLHPLDNVWRRDNV